VLKTGSAPVPRPEQQGPGQLQGGCHAELPRSSFAMALALPLAVTASAQVGVGVGVALVPKLPLPTIMRATMGTAPPACDWATILITPMPVHPMVLGA